ncbi:AAA family ATPase [uncultured Helicobacter sp.]|uniref:AAA family ATPase n=1 Tax=uncultured Helicobacter sp. TaxID=175537 RepID=UPI00374E61E5
MPKSKNLIFSLIALSLAGLLIAFMFLRDRSVVLSPYDFHKKLLETKPQNIVLKDNELSFSAHNETYKVARDSINLAELDPHIAVVTQQKRGSFLDEIGLFIIIFIGVAVLIKAVLLLFMPPKPQLKGLDINAQNLSGTIARKEHSPMMPLEQGLEPHLQSTITFKDVAGITQVKEELLEIIDYLKNTKKYQDLGIRLPKGVLLVGPPGVGKTMIAKAVAGEAGVPFFYQSGSSFVQIYVGMGAKRVRELFMRAKAKSPSIVFIDEIDAVGKARGGTRNDEREATLNQLLTEMDGFEDSSGVIVIGATNKIDVLDEALLRSGRFDRRIYVDLPDLSEREKIFKVYLRDKKYDFAISEVARLCVGFSGAAIASLVNEAALSAFRRQSDVIQKEDILNTKDKVLLGKKKILSFSEEEKRILATYQSAKALSAYWLDIDFDKISLISESFKDIDRELVSKTEMSNKIKIHLAGSIAVEMLYNQVFSNAKEDIAKAKQIALQMCEDYGMGKKLIADSNDVAEMLEQCKKEMQEFLANAKPLLQKLSTKLLEQERLHKDEIKAIIDEKYFS